MLLCLLSAINCGKGQKLLATRPKWREFGVIEDWIVLLERLLEWKSWPNSPKMLKTDVLQAKTKHRCIVCLMRRVAARQAGMGLKLMKFHRILHMADAILNFRVPLECDTGVDKSHHIPAKAASQLTQRDLAKVEEQTAERLLEMELLGVAQAETEGNWLCDCQPGHDDDNNNMAKLPRKLPSCLGGSVYHTEINGQTGRLSMVADRAEHGKRSI